MSCTLCALKVDAVVIGGAPGRMQAEELIDTATDVARTTLPFRTDRERLLDAASTLINAIEAVRPARDMHGLRDELNTLQHNAEHMRRAVGRQAPVGRHAQLFF